MTLQSTKYQDIKFTRALIDNTWIYVRSFGKKKPSITSCREKWYTGILPTMCDSIQFFIIYTLSVYISYICKTLQEVNIVAVHPKNYQPKCMIHDRAISLNLTRSILAYLVLAQFVDNGDVRACSYWSVYMLHACITQMNGAATS